MGPVSVEDAYVRRDRGGSGWQIGTDAIEWTYALREGELRLEGFVNRAGSRPRQYVDPLAATVPFAVAPTGATPWVLQRACARRALANGMPVVELVVELRWRQLLVRLHACAYPGTSVLRQWLELENAGAAPMAADAVPWKVMLQAERDSPFTQHWIVGGNSRADQGLMNSAPVTPGYRRELAAGATWAFMPWTALERGRGAGDGWFVALDYLGHWSLTTERPGRGPIALSAGIPDLAGVTLAPGQTIELPAVTVGVFSGTLDDMMVRVYDWQYRYQWDYTNTDYYARPKWAVPWTYCCQNLQEQFAERLAFLDMDADMARQVGFEVLWDDAGWSSQDRLPPDTYGSVFTHQYEGPDFRVARRYLDKMGLGWLAWFCGRPASGIIAGKVGAWGPFEWRTDGVDLPDWAADQDLRGKIRRFLDRFPRASFHTCSGGSAYSHTFEIQRLANTNYFSDAGRGPQTNHYFSYIEPPDKWVDVIEPWSSKGVYRPETGRQMLTMVPFWGWRAAPGDQELLRHDLDLYRYLRREGVAGRWSYLFHPTIQGDEPFYYAQRTSRDRTKACVIIKHQALGPVTVFPRGLLPRRRYAVEFAINPARGVRTGADLMAKGIAIHDQAPGELIFLGMPDRPGTGRDRTPPTPPSRVLARREVNVGHAGVGIYWSAGSDERWVSYYEVQRGHRILGKASIGTYFFDHGEGWDPAAAYAVRTVDGDGNASDWTAAGVVDEDRAVFCALGGHFPVRGRDGWCADTTVDGIAFAPMVWVCPPRTASADDGGTPNQPGGIEGLWQGPGGERLGRAWMQSSRTACCVRTWIAPRAGTLRVTGRVMKEWYSQEYGADHRVRILHGTQAVWPERGWAVVRRGDLAGVMHDITVEVAAQDAIRFVLDRRRARRQARLRVGAKWTVFGLCDRQQRASDAHLAQVPAALVVGDRSLAPQVVKPGDGRLDLGGLLGDSDPGTSAYVYIPVHAPRADRYRLGFGVQGWYCAWLDGKCVSDTALIAEFMQAQGVTDAGALAVGRTDRPADREAHPVNVLMEAGDHVLVLRCVRGGVDWGMDVGIPECDEDDPIAWMPTIAYTDGPEPVPSGSVVRILCGAARPYRDLAGNRWAADRCYRGGRAVRHRVVTTCADDPALYRHGRCGQDFAYEIPVEPGIYTVRLRMTEPEFRAICARPICLELNGTQVLQNADVSQQARGCCKAHDQVFRNVVPNGQGRIELRFCGGTDPYRHTDEALVQAIEVLPERRTAVRVACGSTTDFVDWNSDVWRRDGDLGPDDAIHSSRPVAQATPTRYDQALYQTARCGRDLRYAIPVPPGLYEVHLKFAELWLPGAGMRPMDILVNGQLLWEGWDPATAAGECGMAIDLRAPYVAPDGDGKITVRVRAAGAHEAILQGIEVE